MFLKLNHFLSVILIFLLSLNAFAGGEPVKFGKVTMEELEMTTYSPDSSAPAVILCDYGRWSLRDYKFRKTIRIKILTKEGLDYADQVYPSDDQTTIRGKTYNIVDGKIEATKLKSESIFKERIYDDYYNFRIAMPNVKVGSVIDIEITHFGIPSVWYFQKDIPVKWSELIIPQSMYIDYRKNGFGNEPLYINASNRWVGKEMPAFKAEPFISSEENFITKFEFDVRAYHFPGYYKEFTTDWDAVARRLQESSYFGNVLKMAVYLKDVAKEIEAKDSTKVGRMKLAFEAAKKIKWNEDVALQTSKTNLGSVYKKKIGNSADINLILVNLLRKLDISAYPLVLSTRDNGMLPLYSPSLNKLNYVIAYAKVNHVEYLMDATDENVPFGLLPKRCLNFKGRIIGDGKTMEVSLMTDKKDLSTEMYNLKVAEDFTIKGTVKAQYKDYSAYYFRKNYKSFNSEEEFLDDQVTNKGVIIENYKIEGIDNLDKHLAESYNIEIKNKIQQLDDKYYITPLLHLVTDDNPFKSEERKLPVSFPFMKSKSYIVSIELPEGYVVEEAPKPLRMSLPNKAGSVLYQITGVGNKIMLSYKFLINKTEFTNQEYQMLREFYNQIIKKQSEPVIFIKK